MKPLNLDNKPCSPVSSNCVVWQGPDISCINLCKGDTVSDVVAALATELCTILEQTNVSNYDLTCLGVTACGPKDFQALIQLLIEEICNISGFDPDTVKSETGCPDCPVTVAECFRTGNVVTMQLLDYVQMIAERICSLITEITTINSQITDILIRLEDLENTPIPDSPIPSFTLTSCAVGSLPEGSTQFINVVLEEFINNVWCPFYDIMGTTTDLVNAIDSICIADSDLQLTTGTSFASNPNWIQSAQYDTVADAINNIWIALCDVYNAVDNISLTVQDTNSIDLTFSSGTLSANIVDTGWVNLEGFGFYGAGVNRPQCRRIGNQVHFRGVVVVPLPDPVTPSVAYSYTSTSYNSVASPTTYTGGPNGCNINVNGSITFNQNNSVIPSSVVASGENLDNTYGMGWIIGTRQIDLAGGYGTALSAALSVGITFDKKLYVAVLKDLEYTSTIQNPAQLGSSHLRYITSNVTTNEFVPNFINPNTSVHSSLYSGDTHQIDLPAPLGPDNQYINNLNLEYNTFRYPFNCNAGDETQIGGFAFRIDGLIAYLDPCTSDIKQYGCK